MDEDALSDDGRDETPNERADRNWLEILQELRVAQTGTQVLAGFLLAVAFQPRFTELEPSQRAFYLVLVGIAGVSTVLGLAPVGLHRVFFGRQRKGETVRIGNRLLALQLVAVAALAAGVTCFVFDFVLGHMAGGIALVGGLVLALALLVVIPRLALRRSRSEGE
ncbi:DUF6328 family protein [Leucobacter ruminantium]|uniref:Sodium:proton antiporter n=1 Tax=Leucobacter ruminantium TaxID=1289170 RepID=A0A939RXD5_9MICO|nr:sodium:proton antiporter [Leucobacter ruminantium]